MKIKIIVLDLDGTVLHNDKTISDYTLSIFEKCKDKGIHIVVATARSEKAAERYLNKICPDVVISNGGSLIKYNGNIIFECKLSAITADSIINELMSQTGFISISVETSKGYFVTWEKPDSNDYSHAIQYNFEEPLSQDVYKITVELSNSKDIAQIVTRYSECSMIPFSDDNFYRFAHRNSTKINAVEEVAKYFDVDISNVAAFGDDYNDFEMIRDCGIGVAMENGINNIKEVANYICEANDNDGVAKWIEHFLL